jgi:signal peptidase II
MTPRHAYILGFGTALPVIALDQLSKHWLLSLLDFGRNPDITVTSFFNLVMVWNHGVSFGLFSEHRQPYALIAVALAMVAFLMHWLKRAEHRFVAIAIGLVIGGAIGNVIDRLRFGAVADFFDFHVMGYHWPAFNIADSCIFIGVVVLLLESIVAKPKPKD